MNYKKEISKLSALLTEANIPFEIRALYDGYQIAYPKNDKNIVCDAICHSASYGHEDGLLEIMGLVNEEEVWDTVEGYLTAEEVFNRIKEHYSSLQTPPDRI